MDGDIRASQHQPRGTTTVVEKGHEKESGRIMAKKEAEGAVRSQNLWVLIMKILKGGEWTPIRISTNMRVDLTVEGFKKNRINVEKSQGWSIVMRRWDRKRRGASRKHECKRKFPFFVPRRMTR